MQKNRTFLLVVASMALGLLVFLDNWRADDVVVRPAAPSREQAGAAANADAAVSDADTETSGSGETRLTNPLADFDKALLKDWVERPLFASSRKRPPTVATAAAALPTTSEPVPDYDLLGVLRDGDHAIALLRKKGEGTSFRVEVGDMIGGWRVAKLESALVVLERVDGTTQTVPLMRE